MSQRIATVLVAGALAALAASAVRSQAPEGGRAAAEAVPRYRVEFIIFAHRDLDAVEESFRRDEPRAGGGATPERVWPFGIEPGAGVGEFGERVFTDRPPAADDDGPAPAGPGARTDGGDALEPIGPDAFTGRLRAEPWFERLEADELMLGEARRRLERVDAYEVLAHAGWEQAALPETELRSISLGELGIMNPSGTLQLRVSRFLHLAVDLDYRTSILDGRTRAPARPARDPGFGGLGPIRTVPAYALEQERRARRDELHYIDHPLYGVLFQVRRAPEAPEERQEEAPAGLLPAA